MSDEKIQRWIDLLAALLRRRFPATFGELARDVPGYRRAGANRDSMMRMFERDKAELRDFGIAIRTKTDPDDSENTGYQLAARNFYLPYLCLRKQPGARPIEPERREGEGYRALSTLVFEAEELEAIAQAAAIVGELGDPVLAEEARRALRKLSFDAPMQGLLTFAGTRLSRVRATAGPPAALEFRAADFLAAPPRDHFAVLSDALFRRKRVHVTYYSMHRAVSSDRALEPFGLYFSGGTWYLAAREEGTDAVKSFRVSRITRLTVETARPMQPDFEVPADFDLREYARTRHPWELGDGDEMRVVVDFTGESGAVAAAARLGETVGGARARRAFRVRRPDAFARWLLSFGGDARVVAPAAVQDELARQLDETARIYAGDPDA